MKVSFFRHSLLSRGGDKMVCDYANYLFSRGYDVIIESGSVNTVYGIATPVRSLIKFAGYLGTIVDALFKKRDHDVIIGDIIVTVLLLALRNRGRVIYFSQDYDASYYSNPMIKILIRLFYFIALRILKIPVIAVSFELGALLKSKFKADVAIVLNGVDANHFYPEKDERYSSLKGSSKIILVFARSDYRKGFDIVIRTLIQFKDVIDNGHYSVWAVGEELDVPFLMHNFGFVTPSQLRKIFSSADVLFYPSRHEGFGLLAIEAMACGCPVVMSSNVPLGIHGASALKCGTDDIDGFTIALQRVLLDTHCRSRIIANGFALASKYVLADSRAGFESELLKFKNTGKL